LRIAASLAAIALADLSLSHLVTPGAKDVVQQPRDRHAADADDECAEARGVAARGEPADDRLEDGGDERPEIAGSG
jgi:hypothetical protein